MHPRQYSSGFTLIELMIVLAIIGVLAAIALPRYLEYTIRSRNAECISAAMGAKAAVSETFQDRGIMPSSNSEANYAFAGPKYCSSIAIGAGGEIVATTDTNSGVVFTFRPIAGAGHTDWSCTTNPGASPVYIPASCR